MSHDKLEHILAILGALVPICSALASLVNHLVRAKQAKGQEVSPLLLGAGSLLNAASINLDKAVQLGKLAKGLPVPRTQSPALPAPEAPAAPAEQEDPLVCPQCGAKIGVT